MLLKWIGGKVQLGPWLHQRMPDHERYYEIFFGAGGFFWDKPLAKKGNVINDLNSKIINLYRVVKNEETMKQLVQCFDNVIYSRELFDAFKTLYDDRTGNAWLDIGSKIPIDPRVKPSVQRAFVYIYLNRCSFNGQFQTFAHRSEGSPIYNLTDDIKRMFFKLNEGQVVIEQLSFEDMLEKVPDASDVFVYLDPPYWVTVLLQGKSYYEKVMTTEQHTTLRNMVCKFKQTKWMMSYDDVPEIRELYEGQPGVFINKTAVLNQSSSNANEKTTAKHELVISNYDINQIGGLFGGQN